MADLSNKTARKKLKPRGSAYTQRLAEGRALGYRKRTSGAPGRWMLRTAKPAGGYAFEVLGVADDNSPADGHEVLSYAQALAASLGKKVADPTRITVAEALDDWAREKRQTATSEKQRRDIDSSARRISDVFGQKTLKTITAREIFGWMDGIVAEGDDPRPRRSTANRRLANLKAALTRAADKHEYTGVRGWEAVKKFDKAASFGARMVILSPKEEEHLIENARPDVAVFLIALQMTGARPGEIRAANVGDVNGNRLDLDGKTGPRSIALSPEKARWFAEQAAERPPTAPLLCRQDGSAWPDGGHLKPVKAAVKAAGLSSDVTAYAFRHGFISRALAEGVPVAAVAQHCGTSVEIIMRSYAKFIPAQMSEWFA